MKMYGGVHVYIHIILTSALIGGELSTSRPCRFIPEERAPRYPLDPKTVLDDVLRENSWSYQDSNSDPYVVQPVASRYTDWAIPTPETFIGLLLSDSEVTSMLLFTMQ
jgi:hypothetical protein